MQGVERKAPPFLISNAYLSFDAVKFTPVDVLKKMPFFHFFHLLSMSYITDILTVSEISWSL